MESFREFVRYEPPEFLLNSPAANALQENFAMLSPAFDQYIDQLDRFVLFLSSTAQAYQENESVLGG